MTNAISLVWLFELSTFCKILVPCCPWEKEEMHRLTFRSLRMKRISMSQRNVAAAPVHTRMITSTFGFPSSPGKRRTVINYQTTLAKNKNSPCVLFLILEVFILYWLRFVKKLDQKETVCYKFFSKYAIWNTVYKKEVETTLLFVSGLFWACIPRIFL